MDDMTVGQKIAHAPQFAKHQILSLKPPGEIPLNPFKCLGLLNLRQWSFFIVGLWGWTWVLRLETASLHRTHLISFVFH
jgi:hypothetical protein